MSSKSTIELVERIAGLDRPLLLALDVDGTLAPIVREPHLAAIPERTLSMLEALATTDGVELALVTGRDLESLRRMENLEGIWRAVEHGGLVLAPGESPRERTLPEPRQQALERFREWADRSATDAFVEHKPQGVAVHVRTIAESDPTRAEHLLAEADERAAALGLFVRRGKALREAEAVRSDKGSALEEIIRRTGAASTLFAGDDITDFPAIELGAACGIGIFVRSDERRATPTESAVTVAGVDELTEVLHELCRRLGE